MDNYLDFSNEELRIKLKTLENEYSAIQSKLGQFMDKMTQLDQEYVKIKETLMNRTQGRG